MECSVYQTLIKCLHLNKLGAWSWKIALNMDNQPASDIVTFVDTAYEIFLEHEIFSQKLSPARGHKLKGREIGAR